MERREALRRLAVLVGGTASVPTVASVLSGCGDDADGDWRPSVLSEHQNEVVVEMSDHIIPSTETPGASDVYVNRFIDKLLEESLLASQRAEFQTGLEKLEERCEERYGRGFLVCSKSEQRTFLTELDEEAFGSSDTSHSDAPTFFRMMKELTLIGYYTSEIGASEELNINIVPGRYDGCVPYEEVGRAWSQEV